MTSLSLKKHRIIRSSTRKTTTKLPLAACLTLLSALGGTLSAEDKILPPVDVTETAEANSNNQENSDAGKVTLSTLPPASDFDVTKTKVQKASVTNDASRTNRELMNALRRGVTLPVKPTPAVSVKVTTEPSPATGMKINSILQTAGQDDEAGVITIPQTSEPLPPIAEMPQTLAPSTVAPSCPAPGQISMKQLRKNTKRAQRQASGKRFGSRFIEFYDPDLERLDVDGYDRTILLISDSDEIERAPAPAADNIDDESVPVARRLFQKKITSIKPTLEYAWGDRKGLPKDFDRKLDEGQYVARTAPRTVLQWEPTNLWYHPLYFEDVGLERYGHTRKPWLQPFVSSGRFFGQVAMLPYQMTLHPPKSKEFALGHYQPGEWAPKKRYRVPFNEEATAVEFLWITGLILLIP